MPARMTETARRQNWKNALIYAVFLVAFYGLTTLLSSASVRNRFDGVGLALPVAWSLFLVVFAGQWIYGRIIGGRVLLDCGPYPDKWGLLAAAVFLLILTVGWGLHTAPHLSAWNTAFSVSVAALFCAQAFGRLQVRDHGIWDYWGLLRWSKIASYSWTDDCTLVVRKRGILSLRAALSVPPEQKQAVDDLLGKLCEVGHGT